MRLECGKDPQFKCDHCPYKAYQKIALQKHTYCKHRVVNAEWLFILINFIYTYIIVKNKSIFDTEIKYNFYWLYY